MGSKWLPSGVHAALSPPPTPDATPAPQASPSLLQVDRILLPVHRGDNHWAAACIYLKEKRIEYWDSLGVGGLKQVGSSCSVCLAQARVCVTVEK